MHKELSHLLKLAISMLVMDKAHFNWLQVEGDLSHGTRSKLMFRTCRMSEGSRQFVYITGYLIVLSVPVMYAL